MAAWGPGRLGTIALLLVLLGFAVSVDFPRAAHGFKGDEATYYSLTYSIVRDRDFAFQRRDLIRVWDEFPSGPEGIFLKRGSVIHGIKATGRLPFVGFDQSPDPSEVRLFYGKSYIYPLIAAPFVALFGTSGFLILHALLMALNYGVVYRFLAARGSPPGLAALFAAVFLGASVVPVYFVWLAPELFNFSLVLYAVFLCVYKRVTEPPSSAMTSTEYFLRSPGADSLAAILLGIVTFSKPTHVLAFVPLAALLILRKEWRRLIVVCALFAIVTSTLFAANAAITGELNYQGGDRKSFNSATGFPFANAERFLDRGASAATDAVPLDILLHRDTALVLLWNLYYFLFGRYSGLLPYFFPGVMGVLLFLFSRSPRALWQWVIAGGLALSAVALLAYMPYTYSGGGGPIGNRYFLSFYPLFLFVMPPLQTVRPALVALAIGALFTAKLVMNPFYTSFNPGEHAKSGPLRWLPIELTLLNDLPVAADGLRARRSLGGVPPVAAYFPDDNAYLPEGDSFWVRGHSRADVLLRAPARVEGDHAEPLAVRRLDLEVTNGPRSNHVVISSGWRREVIDLAPGEVKRIDFKPGGGVPYKPALYPTNYIYVFSVSTSAGFVPFLEEPGSNDSRYLGVSVKVTPVY
ncbi:MAG TPA: hypothetical protein VH740_27220 [Vicinamibacterales bacterium]|jgi:hypothetical protein